MDNKKELLYNLMEMRYKELNNNLPDTKLFPSYWDSIVNIDLKIKALEEAIKEKKLLQFTKIYQNVIEDVK